MQESELAGLYVKLRKLRVKHRQAHRKGDTFACESYEARIENVKALLRAERACAEAVEEKQAA